jgi:hypothetical protein
MTRNLEQCTIDEKPGRWSSVHVTMNPKGMISLTRFALEVLDSPEAVHLFFEKLNQTIYLKPTKLVMKHAFPVKQRGRCGGGKIRAFRLCEQFGIRLPETVRFIDPQIDADGMMNLDLRKVKRGSNGHRKRHPARD